MPLLALAHVSLEVSGGLQPLCGEGGGDARVVLVQRGVVAVRRLAADKREPRAAAVAHGVEDLYAAYLARARDVGRAAGAHVDAGNLDYAHEAAELLLAAVFHPAQLLRGGQKRPDRQVGPDGAVGLELAAGYVLRRELDGEVERHAALAHVEADVLAAEEAVDGPGEDVLAAVALHPREPYRPVDRPFNGAARLQRLGQDVVYGLLRLAKRDYGQAVQAAGVRLLPAAARENRRAVEHDAIRPVFGLAGYDAGGEGAAFAVGVVEFFGHDITSMGCCAMTAALRLLYHIYASFTTAALRFGGIYIII